MSSKHARVSILTLALILGGCTSSAGTTSPPAPSSVAVATLTATIVPTATLTATPASSPEASSGGGGGGAQPTPGAIDPCTLLRTIEASRLMGKTLGAGVSQKLGPDRVCTFKSGLTEVKVFLAPPAPDAATAKAYWDAERARVPAEITVTDLSYFDRSAFATYSANGASLSGLFVIDGQNVFEVYCGFPACTQTASVGASQLIAGRLQ